MQPILQHIDPLWKGCIGGWITDDSKGTLTFGITHIVKEPPTGWDIIADSLRTTLGLCIDPSSKDQPRLIVRAIFHKNNNSINKFDIGLVPKRISQYIIRQLSRIQYGIVSEVHTDFTRHQPIMLRASFFYLPKEKPVSIIQSILMEKLEIQEEIREQNEIHCLRI